MEESKGGKVFVKVCGITTVEQATAVVECGVDAIGVNLIPGSKRAVSRDLAQSITLAVAGRAKVFGVIANLVVSEAAELRQQGCCHVLQLHGEESISALESLLPDAVKAVRIGGPADAELAERVPGEVCLVDAKIDGALGGTGQALDWSLVVKVAQRRKLILAGGLRPDNVYSAIRQVRPYGVDVASGVETSDPRLKDLELVRAFVSEARRAAVN